MDDDSNLLEGLQRHLRRRCEVRLAVGAENALKLIESEAPFSVVVSDLRMPGMDGIAFLREVAQRMPDAAGVLLTGNADLNAAIKSVNAGHVFRFLTKPCPPTTLLSAIFDAHQYGKKRRSHNLLIEHASERDMITGLHDRRRLMLDIEKYKSTNPEQNLAVVIISINDMAIVRQTIGHASANQLMVGCAMRIHDMNTEMVYRVDEQLALLKAGSLYELEAFAAQILSVCSKPITLDTQTFHPSIQIGVAFLNNHQNDADISLRSAQSACTAADGYRIRFYSDELASLSTRRLRVVQALRSPTLLDELSCVYQPQWQLNSFVLSGIEALLRWKNPELGDLSPAEFIPVAEQEGLSERISDWVLHHACSQRKIWKDKNLISDHVRIAVNLSGRDFDDDRLFDRIHSCLLKNQLPPQLLEIEVTESIALTNLKTSVSTLHQLRVLGVTASIDDFGIGYSALSYLAKLPADALKLDRSFISDICTNPAAANLVRGVTQLGHAMGMRVLAEGAESIEQLKLLSYLGCDCVQGYAISKPKLALELEAWFTYQASALETQLKTIN